MAVFNYSPDYGASRKLKPVIQNVQFGDGYISRYAFGINTLPAIWSVSFSNRDLTEAQAIDSFLKDKSGVTPFQWTPPGESSPLNFVCQEWDMAQPHPNLYTITAQFVQVFDP